MRTPIGEVESENIKVESEKSTSSFVSRLSSIVSCVFRTANNEQRTTILSLLTIFFLLITSVGWGQTNPTAHALSSSNFSFTGFADGTTTTYPTSMQGHKFPAERTTSNLTDNADGDRVLADNSTGITSGSIRNEVANGISLLNSGSNHIGAIVISVNSTGRSNLTVSWTAQQLNSGGSGGTDRINGLRLQYRIGTSGSFTDVSSTEYLTTNTTSQNAAQSFSNIALPSACNNQAVVHIRWVYYISSGTANGRDRIRLDEITISSTAALSNDANLSALSLSSGTLSPDFSAGTTSYTASVANAVSSITVTPTRNQANATITVNGISVTSGNASGNISLNVGDNTINVVVTAQDGSTKTYTVTVTRAAAAGAPTLTAATVSGALTSTFGAASTGVAFTAAGTNLTTTITATPQSGYEISSTLNGTYQSTAITGIANPSTLYVRLAAGTNAGDYNSNAAVVLSGGGASSSANITTSSSGNTISKANQTISVIATTMSKTFGDPTYSVATSSTSGLTISYTSSNLSVATVNASGIVTVVGAGSATITAAQAGNANYNAATSVTQALTVSKANQTITAIASTMSKTFGDPTYSVATSSTSGLTISYTSSNLSVATVNASGIVTVVGAGSATITAAQAGNANYNAATSVTQALTVSKASQTISGLSATDSKTTSTCSYNLAATASSGLTVSYSSSNTSVATIAGSVVTILGAGTTTITASQAGNSNYDAASNIAQTLTVTTGPIYWDFQSASPCGVPTNLTVSALAGGNNNGSIASLLSSTSPSTGYAGASGNNNAGAAAKSGSLNSSTSTYFEFTLTPAIGYQVGITAISFGSRSTGTGPVEYSLRSSLDNYASDIATGLITTNSTWALESNSGLTVTSVTGAAISFRIYGYGGSGTTAGTVIWRIDDLSLSYTLTQKQNPTINTPPIASAITYGQALSSSSLSGGVASVAGTFDFTTPASVPNGGTSNQSVTFTPTDQTNYNNVTFNVSVTVNKANLNVTADPVSKDFGTTLTTTVAGLTAFTSSGLVNGDAISSVTITYGSSFANAAATIGTYTNAVTPSAAVGVSANNYNINYVTANGTVDPEPVYWNFGTAAPTSGVPANLTVSNLSQGNNNGTTSLLDGTSASTGYTGASGTNNAGAAARTGSISTAVNGSAYFEFTLTPGSGYQVSLNQVKFGSRSTSTGPAAYSIRSSINSYSTDIAAGILTPASSPAPWTLETNSGLTIASSTGTAATFRIYGHSGAGSPGANTANWRIDDLKLYVDLTCVTPQTQTASAEAASVCSGTSTNIQLSNSQTGVSYQLRNNADNSNIGSPVSGTGAAISLSTGNLSAATTFNVLATSVCGATQLMSGTPTVTGNTCYNITYEANGGTGSKAPTTHVAGDVVTLPTATGITRPNYNFIGWNTQANGSGTFYTAGTNITINSDITLYARWGSIQAAPGAKFWKGGSGNWSVSSNWEPSKPVSGTDNVYIEEGSPVMNESFIIGSGKDFTLTGTASLTINSGVTLTITGTADFNDRPVTLKSDANGSASIGEIGNDGNNLSGASNVTVERYLSGKRKWRALTSPVTGSSNNTVYANWQNNGTIAGNTGAIIWSPTSPAGSESATTGLYGGGVGTSLLRFNNNTWEAVTNTRSETLFTSAANKPYMLFFTGPYNKSGTYLTGGAAASTLSAKGTLRTGTVEFNNLPQGYHMIANPYASPVKLKTGTGLNNNVYIWNINLAGVGGYTGLSLSNNPTIQSGQAFFIYSNGNGSYTFTEGDKVGATSSSAAFRTDEVIANGDVKIELKKAIGGVMETYDVAILNYKQRAEAGLPKLAQFHENLSIYENNIDYGMSTRIMKNGEDMIQLRMWQMQEGAYQLNIDLRGLKLPAGSVAVLQDAFLNKETVLSVTETNKVDFRVDANAATGGQRFRIVLRRAENVIVTEIAKPINIYPNPVAKGGTVQLDLRGWDAGRYEITIYGITGAQMQKTILWNNGTATTTIKLDQNLASGTYFVEVLGINGTKKSINLFVQ